MDRTTDQLSRQKHGNFGVNFGGTLRVICGFFCLER